MRTAQYTVTPEDVQAHAAHLCHQHLRLKDHGPKTTAAALLALLCYAAARLTSLGAACKALLHAPGYAETIRHTPVPSFASMLLSRAGPTHNVWLVWSPGYKSLGRRCEQLAAALGTYRVPGDDVRVRWSSPEHMGLIRFDPLSQYSGAISRRCRKAASKRPVLVQETTSALVVRSRAVPSTKTSTNVRPASFAFRRAMIAKVISYTSAASPPAGARPQSR